MLLSLTNSGLKQEVFKLPADTTCPICKDPIRSESETPIQLISCCSQICGARCMKIWLSQKLDGRNFQQSCPMCRSIFPDTFVRKLFTPDQYRLRLSGIAINDDANCVGTVLPSLTENIDFVSMAVFFPRQYLWLIDLLTILSLCEAESQFEVISS